MRPNTPHVVMTPEASICHGGHFYASSTLRHTCHGILHTFVACSLLTNTEHTTASRELIGRILFFYYKVFQKDYVAHGPSGKTISPRYRGNIPDIFTFEGLLDVLSLCNLMELGNIIHYKTYTSDGINAEERRKMIAGRACGHQVRKWPAANIEIHHPHETPSLRSLDRDVFYIYLSSQVASLLHYKMRAPASEAQGHVDFSLKDLVAQIRGALGENPHFQACYKPAVDPKTFDWVGPTYRVQPVEGYREPQILEQGGETPDDLEWLKIQQDLSVIGCAELAGQDHGGAGDEEITGSSRKRMRKN